MEHITKQEIVQTLNAYMKEHKMSQADVSNSSGVRKEYLSNILKEGSMFMYSAGDSMGFIPVKHFLALAKLCGYQTEKTYWQIQPTAQSTAIFSHLKEAKENAQTIVLVGETGCGKSTATKIFASRNPIDTFIVTAGSSDSLNDLIGKMMDVLCITVINGNKSEKIQAIAKRLKRLKEIGHTPMLMVDESEFLKVMALCAVKEIHDYIHEFCSIVLIGTDQLVTNIERLRKKNHPGIPQFHRRIKFGLRVLPNIDRKFEVFMMEIEERDLKKFLLDNCKNYGELHDVLVPVYREAERMGEPITLNLVRKVLNLPDGNLLW